MQETLKLKENNFDSNQHLCDESFSLKLSQMINKEKIKLEHEQNLIIKRELLKINQIKSKEMTKIQEELLLEKNRANKLEKVFFNIEIIEKPKYIQKLRIIIN